MLALTACFYISPFQLCEGQIATPYIFHSLHFHIRRWVYVGAHGGQCAICERLALFHCWTVSCLNSNRHKVCLYRTRERVKKTCTVALIWSTLCLWCTTKLLLSSMSSSLAEAVLNIIFRHLTKQHTSFSDMFSNVRANNV